MTRGNGKTGRGGGLRRSRGWLRQLRDFTIVTVGGLLLFFVLAETFWFVERQEIDDRILIEVPEGVSLRAIAEILDGHGLLRDPEKFVTAARFMGLSGRLQAGTYEFGPEYSEFNILTALKHGEVAGRHITIPEGYRASQIAELLEDVVGISAAEFTAIVHDSTLIAELGLDAPSLEGYLHPDTYRIRLDAGAKNAVHQMIGETMRFFDRHLKARADSLGMSIHEVLTLASIIEAEAMVDSERPRISAVYHNRLAGGWRLEADPTIRYALGRFRRKLYYGDLDVDSPYNTYRNEGLPPGPICSPGGASIEAALYPLRDSQDFFFVSNGDGTHTFSRTFQEHVRARQRINGGEQSTEEVREDEKGPTAGENQLDTGGNG